MKKQSKPEGTTARTGGTMRDVGETELPRVRGGAGNAAIDFAIKPPV